MLSIIFPFAIGVLWEKDVSAQGRGLLGHGVCTAHYLYMKSTLVNVPPYSQASTHTCVLSPYHTVTLHQTSSAWRVIPSRKHERVKYVA